MISVVLGVMVMGVNWIKTGRLARFALFSIVMSAGLTFAALYFNATIFIKFNQQFLMDFLRLSCLEDCLKEAMMLNFWYTIPAHTANMVLASRRWGVFLVSCYCK